jgi:hypothetical protein
MATPFPFTAGQVLTAAELNDITELPINAKTANHTLVAADAGARVQMTSAGATTITVDDSVFTAGQSVNIYNLGAGICTITAGTATVTTSGSLALAQYGGGTLLFTSASAATFFPSGGVGYGIATGGTSSSITVGGLTYTLLTFTSSGTLTVTRAGLFDVLAVGPGGGGGDNGRGGGAGGCITQSTVYLTGNETVTIGAGDTNSTAATAQLRKSNLASSLGNDLVSFVGAQGPPTVGAVGFSDGASGGALDANGINGFDASSFRGEVAGTTYYSGGGAGGSTTATMYTGGLGGGGNGGTTLSSNGVAGATNTGGGGGGARATGIGGAGGSGIILVRFKV